MVNAMSTIEAQPVTEIARQPVAQPVPPPWLTRFDLRLERIGEWLNPILVKEARQALKSKQFAVTFTLLLLCGWGWSLLGIALLSPGVYYAPTGPFMLVGYYFVLAVPLLVVVPFAAFRSLASERPALRPCSGRGGRRCSLASSRSPRSSASSA